MATFFGFIIALSYIALIVLVVWTVVSALNRIARGVEDIAYTLRSTESKKPQSS
jgi:ABC-type sulfate transport system permease component